PKLSVPTVLPPNDIEQIQVNPERHRLTLITKTGTKTITLPDRTSTIDVLKSGVVKITSPQFGMEHHLFIGALEADHVRFGVGMDGLFWKRLDLGAGIAGQIGSYTPIAFAKITYTIKGNVQAGLVYQSNQYVGGILSVRLF